MTLTYSKLYMRHTIFEALIRGMVFALVILLIDLLFYRGTQPLLEIIARAIFMASVLTISFAVFDRMKRNK